ncbi:hypothetical protein Tco_0699567 [Tanacetum coccineum]
MHSHHYSNTPKDSSPPKGEHIKGRQMQKALSFQELRKRVLTNIHLTKKEINHQKKLEEDVKAEAAKQEGKVRKAELVDLLGPEVVKNGLHSTTTKAELGINLDIPLSKQDPLDKLNDLANKKRKHIDDIHDYFKANKRLKSSVQLKIICLIFSNTMLTTLYKKSIFNDIKRSKSDDWQDLSSHRFLLAEVDKRNLNPDTSTMRSHCISLRQ